MVWPPRFIFISARLSVDFAQTGGEGFRARWEAWHTPEDLADWMEQCPLLALGLRPLVTPEDLRAARQLREAVWSATQSALARAPLRADDTATLNTFAAHGPPTPQLLGGDQRWVTPVTGMQVLSTVARDAVALLGTDVRTRLRKCQNPTCFLMFVDTSRAGKRAWCTMQRCGNLNKISRYRGGPGLVPPRRRARGKAARA